jgi:leader peptidase (prepilin peptidase)/N-methyltransferase
VLEIWIPLLIFVLGLAIGSFLNVCIYRIPRADVSIHSPRRSFCPECNEPISPYDNIPVLSYLLLGGKCRRCSTPISVIYPLVELATAGLFLVMYYRFGLTLEFLLALVFVTILVPIFVIDAQFYIIPTVLVWTGLILGLSIVCAIAYQRADVWYLLTRLIGAVAGRIAFWLIAVIGEKIYRKKAMGGGDIELMTLNGLFLGAWPELVMVIGFSALSGAIIGTALIVFKRKENLQSAIPYGPFLVGAAVIVLLWGDTLWRIYLQSVGWN